MRKLIGEFGWIYPLYSAEGTLMSSSMILSLFCQNCHRIQQRCFPFLSFWKALPTIQPTYICIIKNPAWYSVCLRSLGLLKLNREYFGTFFMMVSLHPLHFLRSMLKPIFHRNSWYLKSLWKWCLISQVAGASPNFLPDSCCFFLKNIKQKLCDKTKP